MAGDGEKQARELELNTLQAGEIMSLSITMVRLYNILHAYASRVLLDGIVRANEGTEGWNERVHEPGREKMNVGLNECEKAQ